MKTNEQQQSGLKKEAPRIWRWESMPFLWEQFEDSIPKDRWKDINPADVPLNFLVSMFLRDCAEILRLPDDRIVELHLALVGREGEITGFIRYLKTWGVEEGWARKWHMARIYIESYQRHLARARGLDELGRAMVALENFWMWGRRNGFFSPNQGPLWKRHFKVTTECRVSWQMIKSR